MDAAILGVGVILLSFGFAFGVVGDGGAPAYLCLIVGAIVFIAANVRIVGYIRSTLRKGGSGAG